MPRSLLRCKFDAQLLAAGDLICTDGMPRLAGYPYVKQTLLRFLSGLLQ